MPETLIRLSTRDYTRQEEDERARYRGDLSERRSFSYSRSLGFWPWARAAGSNAVGELVVDNRSGRYDQLLFSDMRDQAVSVVVPTSNGGEMVVCRALVDSVRADGEESLVVSLKDRLTLLDVPLQSEVYDDEADPGVRGRPLPVLFGVVRSVRPDSWQAEPSDDRPRYRLHDAPLSGVSNVRFSGVFQDGLDEPPQWEVDLGIGGAGIVAQEGFSGLLTLDASSSGDGNLGADPVDVLAGIGEFDQDFPANEPPAWSYESGGAAPSATASSTVFNGNRALRLDGGGVQTGRAGLTSDTAALEAGKTYRWALQVFRPVQFFTMAGNVVASSGVFRLSAVTSQAVQDATSPTNGVNLFTRSALAADNQPGIYTGTYTVPESGGRYAQLACVNGGNVIVGRVRFFEVPEPGAGLEGITLANYTSEVINRRGLPAEILSISDLSAVDPNGEPIGFYAEEPITALAALRAPLDSFAADLFCDREGRYRFAKLRDPEGETPDLLLDPNNIALDERISFEVDEAPGLTLSAAAGRQWFRYRDSDFADDPSISLSTKQELKRAFRFVRSATVEIGEDGQTWPSYYRHAINAEPLSTVFDEAESAQAMIDFVAEIYRKVRLFVTVPVWLEAGEFVELDQVARLVYPRYGFDQGKNCLVVGVADEIEDLGQRRLAILTLWG